MAGYNCRRGMSNNAVDAYRRNINSRQHLDHGAAGRHRRRGGQVFAEILSGLRHRLRDHGLKPGRSGVLLMAHLKVYGP